MIARLAAHPGPRPSLSLALELENAGAQEWAATLFEPVVPWDLRAWVDGVAVAVRQPELDLAVRPRRVSLAPGERVELASPIVLVFEGDTGPQSAFVWTLGAPPGESVELEATLTVEGKPLTTDRATVHLVSGGD